MNVHDNLGYMLHKLGSMLEHSSDVILFDEFGIGFSQFKILVSLQECGIMQQKDIANFLGQTEASVSRQIKLLKESHFLTSTKADDNKKANVISLTAKGSELADAAIRKLDSHYKPLFDVMPAAERIGLLRNLHSVYDILQSTCQKGDI